MRLGINKTYLFVGLLTTIISSTAANADTQTKQLKESMTLDSAIIKAYAHKSIELSLTTQKVNISLPVNEIYFAKEKQLVNSNKPVKLTKTSLITE
jgi:hypothetical protein